MQTVGEVVNGTAGGGQPARASDTSRDDLVDGHNDRQVGFRYQKGEVLEMEYLLAAFKTKSYACSKIFKTYQ